MTFMEVIGVLLSILAVIVGILLIIGGTYLFSFASTVGGLFGDISDFEGASGVEGSGEVEGIASELSDFIKGTGIVSFIIIFIISGLIIAVFINFSMTFSENKKYYRYIKEVTATGKYSATVHVPQNRSYVFGTLLIIGIFLVFLSNVLLLLLGLSIGAYIFITAMLFKDIHEAEVRNQNVLQKEFEDIEEINKQIAAFCLTEKEIRTKSDKIEKTEVGTSRNADEGQENTMYTAEQVEQIMQFLMKGQSTASISNEQLRSSLEKVDERESSRQENCKERDEK